MNKIFNLWSTLANILLHPLNRNRKLSALVFFLKWQLSTRLLNLPVIVPWVDDSKIIVSNGDTGLTGNIYCGLFEFEEMSFLLSALQPTDLFIDVGANIGAYTILASKSIGADTIAFEPISSTCTKLRDQIMINNLEHRVDLRNLGVGATQEKLYFTVNFDTVNKVALNGESVETVLVDVVTLDDQIKSDKYMMLKIDIEGFEFAALHGAKNLLANPALEAIIVEINDSGTIFGHSNSDTHNFILSFGFHPIEFLPFTKSIRKLSNFNQSKSNTIYIRDFSRISERLKKNLPHTIHTANDLLI